MHTVVQVLGVVFIVVFSAFAIWANSGRRK